MNCPKKNPKKSLEPKTVDDLVRDDVEALAPAIAGRDASLEDLRGEVVQLRNDPRLPADCQEYMGAVEILLGQWAGQTRALRELVATL